jgi:small subunit ribosomal protein S3
MSRVLAEREGRVPLSTIQSHIEYGTASAMTTYGVIGVKCWIFKGEVGDRVLKRGTLSPDHRSEIPR